MFVVAQLRSAPARTRRSASAVSSTFSSAPIQPFRKRFSLLLQQLPITCWTLEVQRSKQWTGNKQRQEVGCV